MNAPQSDGPAPKSPNRNLIIGVSAAAVVALLGIGYMAGRTGGGPTVQGASPSQTSAAGGTAAQPSAASGPGPVPLTALTAGNCNSFAPEGWKVTDQNADGTVMTATSADGRLIASYAGMGLTRVQTLGLYPGQPAIPDAPALVVKLAGVLTGEQAQQTGEIETVGDYRAVHFSTPTRAGYALVYQMANPADAQGFIAIMRFAIGNAGDQHSIAVAGSVAAATRCTSQLHAPEGGYAHVEARTETHGAASRDGGDDLGGTYNAQLGTGWVHDDTGRNYNVDVTSDWSENGPDGPGYYKHNGNDWTKLKPGLQ